MVREHCLFIANQVFSRCSYASQNIPSTCTRLCYFYSTGVEKGHKQECSHKTGALAHTDLRGYCILKLLLSDADWHAVISSRAARLSLFSHQVSSTHIAEPQRQSESNTKKKKRHRHSHLHTKHTERDIHKEKHRKAGWTFKEAFTLTVIRSMATGSTPTGRRLESIHISQYEVSTSML